MTILFDKEYGDGSAIKISDDDSDWVHLEFSFCSDDRAGIVQTTEMLLDDAVLDDLILGLTRARDLRDRRRRVG